MSFAFFKKLSILKISKAFKRYVRSYKAEIVDSKDPLGQLEATTIHKMFETSSSFHVK